jgi:hypothetical protein
LGCDAAPTLLAVRTSDGLAEHWGYSTNASFHESVAIPVDLSPKYEGILVSAFRFGIKRRLRDARPISSHELPSRIKDYLRIAI